MRCDLHVHTRHSGMCSLPVIGRFCRESCSRPEEVYENLKRRGMELVTVTDHDSIAALEALGGRPDFFLSEEVTCRTPSGTELHVSVYGITERQHVHIQRLRDDLPSLVAYLREQRLFFSANHVFSALTGRRTHCDFQQLAAMFPAFETLNGHMLADTNWQATRLALAAGKMGVGGSDAHTLPSAGSVYTEVLGARDKQEFLEGLQSGLGRVRGRSGGYWKLTREVLLISQEMIRENAALLPLAPFALLVPAAILACQLREALFAGKWRRALERSGLLPVPSFSPAGRAPGAALP